MKIEYLVVHSLDGTKGITEIVNQKIAEGWEPLGGVCASVIDFSDQGMSNVNALHQALIRKIDE